jgi:hypothetical protein
LTAIVAVSLLVTGSFLLRPLVSLPGDAHRGLSLEIALNRILCGATSHLSPGSPSIYRMFGDALDAEQLARLRTVSLVTLARDLANRHEAYCQTLSPFLNNENSLMLLMEGALRLLPALSPDGLFRALHGLRFAGLVAMALALIRVGASPMLALAWLIASHTIVDLVNDTHPLSLYAFLLPMIATFAALLVLAFAASRPGRGALSSVLVSTVLGVVAGFFGNLRSSYYPILVAMFVMCVGLLMVRRRQHGVGAASPTIAVAIMLAFVIGIVAFERTVIQPFRALNITYNSAGHPLMHPIVLGLGVPENPLAQAEGIRWDDGVGLELARRVDSGVTYLGPTYEKALFVYYVKLWTYRFDDMLGAYAIKADGAVHGILAYVDTLRGSATWQRAALASAIPVRNGRRHATALAVATLIVVSIAIVTSWRRDDRGAMLLLALGTLAVMLCYAESVVTMSHFVITYHALLLMWVISAWLLLYQVAFELTVRSGMRLGRWSSATRGDAARPVDDRPGVVEGDTAE